MLATERVRTEYNCVPRDMVPVGQHLLLGFNVFMGLKQERSVKDVFSLHKFARGPDGVFDFGEVPRSEGGGFLEDRGFVKDFEELYRFYKDARLNHLEKTDARLLATFRTGQTLRDVKVLRFGVDTSGRLTYLDNRGDADVVTPPTHDFDYARATRENFVLGRHPHVNILDELFIETVGGDLTIKIENNTETGQGIYSEPVHEAIQSLDDAEFWYARIGALILLKVLPFREDSFRYLVFNTRTRQVTRADAIGQSCVSLPEEQGIIFPGGFVLQTGEAKVFEADVGGLVFQRKVISPNGEDVLYVFFERAEGKYVLFPYNLVRKEIAAPITCHGYSIFPDGQMVVFRSMSEEPTRVHPVQVWQTPFVSAEFAASTPTPHSALGKLGNAELVRGISEVLTLQRLAESEQVTRRGYEALISSCTRVVDQFHWLGQAEVGLLPIVVELRKNAELIVDEFEKVLAMQRRAAEALGQATATQQTLINRTTTDELASTDAFMDTLGELRKQLGHLITVKEVRYIDLAKIEAMEAEVKQAFADVSKRCVEFLLTPRAFEPLVSGIQVVDAQTLKVTKTIELAPLVTEVERLSAGLSLLGEVVGGLDAGDPTQKAKILEDISEVFSRLNRARATVQARKKELTGSEKRGEFASQFKLFAQSIDSALSLVDSPEKCDEQLTRLTLQLEEMEGRFADFEEFAVELTTRREELLEAFGRRKQVLVDERNRRAQNLFDAADRILQSVTRRVFSDRRRAQHLLRRRPDAAEAAVAHGPAAGAQGLGAGRRARVAPQDGQAGRAAAAARSEGSLRRRHGGGEAGPVPLQREHAAAGGHGHSAGRRPVPAALGLRLPAAAQRSRHRRGARVLGSEPALGVARAVPRRVPGPPDPAGGRVRGEGAVAHFAPRGRTGRDAGGDHPGVGAAAPRRRLRTRRARRRRGDDPPAVAGGVRRRGSAPLPLVAARRGDPVLGFLAGRGAQVGLPPPGLEPGPAASSLPAAAARWRRWPGSCCPRCASSSRPPAWRLTAPELAIVSRYLSEELAQEPLRFVVAGDAVALRDDLLGALDLAGQRLIFEDDLRALDGDLTGRFRLAREWLEAHAAQSGARAAAWMPAVPEAAALIAADEAVLSRDISSAPLAFEAKGLLGQHPRIVSQTLNIRLDELEQRMVWFREERTPAWQKYRAKVRSLLEEARHKLRLEELKPKVLSSFVRNRLIDEVYLPLIGANLAKQLGVAGENKRTDRMGLLLLVSPPGYGKTTLMEYVASRLGLIFVKVNGPSLGHEVTSVDPTEAPNATARQEVDRINLSFEMGNNVMLYLDDIQHTNPELLQKFISLCDATRKVEGVWNGRTRTYDLRGKKFCVVMAGNPYTESGERFRIPDMLANRADTYNLGDILGGQAGPVRAQLPRERAHRERRHRAAAHAVHRRPAPGAGDGAGRPDLRQRDGARLQRGGAGRDRRGHPALRLRAEDAADGEPGVHQERLAGRSLPHRAAVQAAGQLPQHEQARREDRLGDDRRGARGAARRPLRQRVADAHRGGRAEPAQAGRAARAADPRAEGALGRDQARLQAGAGAGGGGGRPGGAGDGIDRGPGRGAGSAQGRDDRRGPQAGEQRHPGPEARRRGAGGGPPSAQRSGPAARRAGGGDLPPAAGGGWRQARRAARRRAQARAVAPQAHRAPGRI